MSITIRQETQSDADGITAVIITASRDAAQASHTEHFIAHALRQALAFGDALPQGSVTYHAAFDAQGPDGA